MALFTFLNTLVIFASFLLIITDALLCGERNQCTCRKQLISCKGMAEFDVDFRTAKTLLIDMDGQLQPLDLTLLDGYADVIIVNAPREFCMDHGLRKCASLPDCPKTILSTISSVIPESVTVGVGVGECYVDREINR